ncbi:MAG: F0F1 ATP synthase subunit epsilon [Chthonomonadales bacterium]
MSTFLLEMVTPEHVLFSLPVRAVRAPGIEGSLGILANHSPLMTVLQTGLVKVEHENGDEEYIATSGGFMEVSGSKTIILADTAERAADIDITRAEAAVAKAKDELAGGGTVDYHEASSSLERAMNRLKVAQLQNTK